MQRLESLQNATTGHFGCGIDISQHFSKLQLYDAGGYIVIFKYFAFFWFLYMVCKQSMCLTYLYLKYLCCFTFEVALGYKSSCFFYDA